MRTYPSNSHKAICRLLALTMIVDGRLAPQELKALHDQARAVNIHLWQFAQNPTDQNLPVVVREGAMIRASLFVGTESIARMALGEAPVDTGAAPHALRAGLDRGTVVLAPGESMDLPNGATHTTVRTHFISTREAWDIVERLAGHPDRFIPGHDPIVAEIYPRASEKVDAFALHKAPSRSFAK